MLLQIFSKKKARACKKSLSQKAVTCCRMIGLILVSIFMTMQIRGVVCQSEKFADGIRREALRSSKLKNFEEVWKLSGEKCVYTSFSPWLVSIA